LSLESRKKTNTDDCGYRVLLPQETLDRYGFHVSYLCGTVSMLQSSVPADNDAMHVYFSGLNIARPHGSLGYLKGDLRNSTGGKGASDLQAKASALCEALERYCGAFRGDEPRQTARMTDLGEAAIHPNACMLFSDKQYEERERTNMCGSGYAYVPVPFDPQREIEWTPVWSLTRETVRYLPTSFCYYRYPCDPDVEFCVGCSNGNAAGNCLEEAILQGFLELVERDAVSLWWYNRVRMPGVDLESFGEPYLGQLEAFLRTRRRDLWALDLTNDLKIPAFGVLSRRTDGPVEQIMFGFGAHLDPKVALLRAVTELNQTLVPLLETSQGEIPAHITDPETVEWLQTAKLADHPYLLPAEGPHRVYSSHPRCWTDDLKEDILVCKSRVEEFGLEMLVLDQTRSEIGMPVAKVIVPGLRHFWARFAPGRLYDAPAKLGWLEKPLSEEQLNPIAMFF
jgi:ribosomal protein S12 methylthiotransferase accessory factor